MCLAVAQVLLGPIGASMATDLDLGKQRCAIIQTALETPRPRQAQGSWELPSLSWHCPETRTCWPHFWPHGLFGFFRKLLSDLEPPYGIEP